MSSVRRFTPERPARASAFARDACLASWSASGQIACIADVSHASQNDTCDDGSIETCRGRVVVQGTLDQSRRSWTGVRTCASMQWAGRRLLLTDRDGIAVLDRPNRERSLTGRPDPTTGPLGQSLATAEQPRF
jgi:hypothetical protein